MVAQVHSQNLTVPLESSKGRIRVLHVVENLDTQAVESWLLRVLRASREDYPQVDWAFFCVLGREGRLDDLARGMGVEIIYSRHEIGDKVRFIRSLRAVMKRGRYDILHCHHDVMSAAYLLASQGLSFQKRIVHVHNTSLSLPTPSRVKANLVREPMRQICLRMADQIVGISKEALESLVGNADADPERYKVVHYAIDTDRFSRATLNREKLRKGLGFAPDARVLLFAGRVVSYKNPAFVIDILEQLMRTRQNAVAIFAGVGNQADVLLELAQRKKIEDRVRLLGFRDDLPDLMTNSDVLIWPSLEEPKEGLGLGIVEAQAAGLPILMSHSVPTEAIVVPKLVDVLPLSAGAEAWSERVSEILDRPRPGREESRARVESSSFSMAAGVRNIISLYDKSFNYNSV
jgi:glycosyltransferase involved in cell wall biosynthesis